jgi:ketopantoate hydroxymethyltransferase
VHILLSHQSCPLIIINNRFVKLYEQIGEKTTNAIWQYVQDVKSGAFPVEGEHTYPMSAVELDKFKEVVEERKGREAADI